MIAVHRAFLHEEGLPGRPWYRNLLVAPGRDLGYGATVMPGIAEALADSRYATGEAETKANARVAHEVRRMIACIRSAQAIFK